MSKLFELMKENRQFETAAACNEWKAEVRRLYREELNDTDLLVLDILSRYAVNEKLGSCGAACLLLETLAELAGKSMRTVRRAASKLEGLGILQRIATKERRKQGGYSANIYVLQKAAVDRMSDRMMVSVCREPEKPAAATPAAQKAAPEALAFSKAPDDLEKKESITYLDETYAGHHVPEVFIRTMVPMTRCPKTIKDAWSKIQMAFRKSGLPEQGLQLEELWEQQEAQHELLRRVKGAVRAHRFNEIRKDFGALLYGTSLQMFREEAAELSAAARRAAGVKLYNFLE
ncbi:helix-turn-helix domain-containing protein [Ectobacillus ponti]|uniref:Helix-turn-helix domain-containing protein n=1 Tax=Ectobacillus ponti TaxID=2961894 RepID=A0AA42BNS6_9BACI|nr:helix-turn-helix domain-containing protein [Ectobacillus ponti]MCP8968007.1 helix-turn-helix domain-containing protein [Ectobacillus ponti]